MLELKFSQLLKGRNIRNLAKKDRENKAPFGKRCVDWDTLAIIDRNISFYFIPLFFCRMLF